MNVVPNAASVALINRDKVLLIQRTRAPYFGMWTMPGGRLEPSETAKAAAAREVLEELGLRVFALRPVMRLTMGPGGGFRLQVFATEAFEGTIAPSDEISGYRWVRADQTHGMKLTPHLPEVIQRAMLLFDRR